MQDPVCARAEQTNRSGKERRTSARPPCTTLTRKARRYCTVPASGAPDPPVQCRYRYRYKRTSYNATNLDGSSMADTLDRRLKAIVPTGSCSCDARSPRAGATLGPCLPQGTGTHLGAGQGSLARTLLLKSFHPVRVSLSCYMLTTLLLRLFSFANLSSNTEPLPLSTQHHYTLFISITRHCPPLARSGLSVRCQVLTILLLSFLASTFSTLFFVPATCPSGSLTHSAAKSFL